MEAIALAQLQVEDVEGALHSAMLLKEGPMPDLLAIIAHGLDYETRVSTLTGPEEPVQPR